MWRVVWRGVRASGERLTPVLRRVRRRVDMYSPQYDCARLGRALTHHCKVVPVDA